MSEEAITPNWNGGERRSIPIHILTHVSNELDQMRQEEVDRHEKLDKRFDELQKSVSAYAEKADKVFDALQEAFPTDKRGKPDYYGHARAHEAWIEDSHENKKLRQDIMRTVMGAAAVAIGAWLWAVIVPALRG